MADFRELYRNELNDENTRYFILDTYSDGINDIDFLRYSWKSDKYNLVRENDLFIYRKPLRASTIGSFYLYGSGKLSSSAGIRGLTKKIFILFLIALATQLDIVLKTSFVRDGTVIGFISMEGISIVENATLAGLPIPKVIKNALEIINKKEKDKDE